MNDPASRPWRLYLLLVLVMFIWALNFIATKVALKEIPGALLSGFRLTLAAIFLIPVFRWAKKKDGKTWNFADGWRMALLGSIGIAANQVFFILGLSRTTVSHAAFIFGLVPLAVLLLASAMGHEAIQPRKISGILLALCGVATLQLRASTGGHGPSTAGDLMIIASALTFACYIVFGKGLVASHGPFIPTTFAFFSGAVTLLPMTIYMASSFDFSKVSLAAWLGVLYMAMFSSVVASLLYYYVLGKLPASRVSSFSYLQPLMATALGVTILGEPVSTALVGGGALILGGVFLTERN